ncbi:MAG: hypothetical protein EPN40_07525 [Rhodanobacteraceae bacterium]|nr:MAG: hypothetical protein EPN40_07525 [Rhodanobacteraceae bacterium]
MPAPRSAATIPVPADQARSTSTATGRSADVNCSPLPPGEGARRAGEGSAVRMAFNSQAAIPAKAGTQRLSPLPLSLRERVPEGRVRVRTRAIPHDIPVFFRAVQRRGLLSFRGK